MHFEIYLMYVLQFSNGWSYGEQMCEISKSHPLLKPYKGLSEKVVFMQLSESGSMLSWFFKNVKFRFLTAAGS